MKRTRVALTEHIVRKKTKEEKRKTLQQIFHIEFGIPPEVYQRIREYTSPRKYYPNGTLAAIASFKGLKADGIWKSFYENGKKEMEQHYEDNELHGISRYWREDGSLMMEGNFIRGKEDGTHRSLFDDGMIWREENYQKGKLHGELKEWTQYGLLKIESHFIKGKEDGVCRTWDSDGNLLLKSHYKRGKLMRQYVIYI